MPLYLYDTWSIRDQIYRYVTGRLIWKVVNKYWWVISNRETHLLRQELITLHRQWSLMIESYQEYQTKELKKSACCTLQARRALTDASRNIALKINTIVHSSLKAHKNYDTSYVLNIIRTKNSLLRMYFKKNIWT